MNPNQGAADIEELVARASSGDEDAWREILGLYARRVFAMARSRVKRDELAEEITQSVFVTVAEKIGGGSYDERGSFESWLFRITMNRVRDEVRRSGRQAEPTDPSGFAGIEDVDSATAGVFEDDPEVARLRAALDGLTDADRQVVELRHHAGLSFKQIAAVLEEPMGTLLARHHRALRKLRAMIEEADAPGIEGERINEDA